jgi:hypothetical protein
MGRHACSEALFCYFRLEGQVPEHHRLRLIDQHISFEFVRQQLNDSNSDRLSVRHAPASSKLADPPPTGSKKPSGTPLQGKNGDRSGLQAVVESLRTNSESGTLAGSRSRTICIIANTSNAIATHANQSPSN